MKIAVLGYGVVGSGVLEVLKQNKASITKKAGEEIEVKYILDLRDFPGDENEEKFTKDFEDIINDEEVEIIAEVIGGATFAYDYVKRSLLAGKSVATSNKELVAKYGYELLAIAKEKNVNFMFEASVGGGIPIIRPLYQCLAANELDEIEGILNGTTNYILTKMINEGVSFEECLKKAQELGYAEADPTADVEGIDAQRKISILASLAFGRHVDTEKIKTGGITKITDADVKYAKKFDCVIKLIGKAKRFEDDKVFAMVAPHFVKKSHPLANVNDVFNGVAVKGNAIGDCMFYGPGAGKLPTASAVVADIIDCAKHKMNVRNLYYVKTQDDFILDYKKVNESFYVRVNTNNENKVKEIFPSAMIVKGINEGELAFEVSDIIEGEFLNKLEDLKKKNIEILAYLRILGE